MFRDLSNAYSTIGNVDLSAAKNQSVSVLLGFIDECIPNFPKYYLSGDASERENPISFHLVNYFNSWLDDEKGGFSPFKFSFVKNPSQTDSGHETDIGVVIKDKNRPSSTIIEFEAKRLSDSSNNREYVQGERGGIERFKRSLHGAHLNVCGMFGYMQNQTSTHWVKTINSWIQELRINNTDTGIDWRSIEESLLQSGTSNILKWQSVNVRTNKPAITLYHYFINLTIV